MTTLAELVTEVEDEQVLEACRAMGLEEGEAAGVLASHRARRWLLGLVHLHGGTAADLVAGRVEIWRKLRALG